MNIPDFSHRCIIYTVYTYTFIILYYIHIFKQFSKFLDGKY